MYVIVASWLLPQDTLKLFQLFGQNPDIAFLNWLLWNILQNTAGKSAAKTQTLHYFSEFVSDRGLFDQLVSGQAVNPLQSRKRQLVVPTVLKAWRRITQFSFKLKFETFPRLSETRQRFMWLPVGILISVLRFDSGRGDQIYKFQINCRDKKSYSRSHISEIRNHLSKIRL